jgi:integrase
MSRLTDVALRAALKKASGERKELADGAVPNLSIRLGPGSATWTLKVRVAGEGGISKRGHKRKGNPHRLTLGEYPATSIETARGLANTYLEQAKKGTNPVAALENSATAGGATVVFLSERFLADYVQMKELRALRKYQMALDVHVLPEMGGVLADVLNREQVRKLIKKAMVPVPRGSAPKDRPRGGKEAARTVVSVLRKMINWGIDEGLLRRKDNPVSGMEKNLPKKKQKERVLSVEEARIAWRAADTLGYPFGPTYQLIMLTGCRPGEWSKARRSWIDLKQTLAVIPADGYKSEHVHVVPLVPKAVEILEEVLSNHCGQSGDHILSGTDGRRPLGGWTKAKARMVRAICALSGDRVTIPWTPHDLRRTVATRIAEQLGVGGEQLIKRVLGHSDGSVTAIYNRYGYVKEMRAVLERWAEELTADPHLQPIAKDRPRRLAVVGGSQDRVA